MIEYIFFHPKAHQMFLQKLQELGIEPLQSCIDDIEMEGLIVQLDEALDDELSDQLESHYDELMDLSETWINAEADTDSLQQVGLSVTLQDGRSVLASVAPDIVNKLLQVLSHDELGRLVDAITDAVENPDSRPLCKRENLG